MWFISSEHGVLQGSKYTGNNRLKVMLDLRIENYKASSKEGRKAITYYKYLILENIN